MDNCCQLCSIATAVVYCKCDCARLCLNCDTYVHSANPLSRKHTRSLICEKCFNQPATFYCMNEKMSVCENCDHNRRDCIGLGHKRIKMISYTDCPSLSDICKIWPFAFDSAFPAFAHCWGSSHSLLNSNQSECLTQLNDNIASFVDGLSDLEPCIMYEPKKHPNLNFTPLHKDQQLLFSQGSNLYSKVFI